MQIFAHPGAERWSTITITSGKYRMRDSSQWAGEGCVIERATAGGDRQTVPLQYRQERIAAPTAFPKGSGRGAGRRTGVRREHGGQRRQFRSARRLPRAVPAPTVEKIVAAGVAAEGVSAEERLETKRGELKRARKTTSSVCRQARATHWWP